MSGLIPRIWLRSGQDELPPQKRISTPAGMRLSVIMDETRSGQAASRGPAGSRSSRPQRLSITKGTTIVVSPPEEDEQPADQDKSTRASSGYSNISEKSMPGEVEPELEKQEETSSKRRSKKIIMILIVVIILLLALVIGLAAGLSRKHSKGSSVGSSGSSSNPSSSNGSGANPPSSTSAPVTVPKDFPLGSYSMVTFLDTVQSNCTSNPTTWTCAPYVLFNDNASKSMANFNWAITAGSTSGSYQISSTDNTYGVNFQNIPLTLVSQGQSSERYQFHVTVDKIVSPTLAGSSATCFFNSTTFQGYLYTKMARDYPLASQPSPNTGHSLWPFAARAEQVIGGGDSVPNCFKTSANGQLGARITDGLQTQDAGNLCSCLYKNWRTPTPP